MIRHGQVVGIKRERIKEYIEYHRKAWPEVLERIKKSNITNYSIYQYEDKLFAYFEYTGDDFEGDMNKMAEDEITQKWWKLLKPMQNALDGSNNEPEWIEMREVFHAG